MLQKASVVEPVGAAERGEFYRFEVAPQSSPIDDVSLVKAVARFGESLVIGDA